MMMGPSDWIGWDQLHACISPRMRATGTCTCTLYCMDTITHSTVRQLALHVFSPSLLTWRINTDVKIYVKLKIRNWMNKSKITILWNVGNVIFNYGMDTTKGIYRCTWQFLQHIYSRSVKSIKWFLAFWAVLVLVLQHNKLLQAGVRILLAAQVPYRYIAASAKIKRHAHPGSSILKK